MARIDGILKRANEIYAQRKGMPDNGFRAPEAVPRIQSDQVMAAIEAVMEEVDRKLSVLVNVKPQTTTLGPTPSEWTIPFGPGAR